MWYALVQNEQLGPMPLGELLQLLSQEVVNAETLVWQEGMGSWMPLADNDEFAHLFEGVERTVAMSPEQAMAQAGFGGDDDFDDDDDDDDGATVMLMPAELRRQAEAAAADARAARQAAASDEVLDLDDLELIDEPSGVGEPTPVAPRSPFGG
ncbi:MAG: DUF4339 domain-containing protein, partial [Myxococcales bacterium]|nr:DUF4339 domain-containing protein [Myxococcales bacterium]